MRLRFATLVTFLISLGAPGHAQFEPAAEDVELVSGLLVGRVDVEPERVVYVAPLPGDDGDGTRESPRRDLIDAIARAEAGTAVHLAPGVYEMSAVRDAFGHASSRLMTRNDGEPGRPIVVRTDPELYEPGSAVATLDFNYENTGDWSMAAFVAHNDYWVFERFEMRRMTRRGFAGWGRHCTYRELHLHHADTDGSDNDALIVMGVSGGGAETVFMGNHLHHVGNIDTSTDALLDYGGVNGGCYYSVTRLSYDSDVPAAGHDATRAEWEAALEPPDGDVYVIGNHAHHCHYGLGLKNNSRGPYYFLSNYVHDVDYGVFSPFRETIVRNNVIHDASTGIQLGRAATNGPLQTFLKMTGNGAHSEVGFNTIVRTDHGMEFLAGWNSRVHHNLVVDSDEPVVITRNQFPWWEDGGWPGIRGEYLIGDLDASHPFWDYVPGYARETPEEFRRMTLSDNCYMVEPVIQPVDFTQPIADITGMTFDTDYRVLTEPERAALFEDEDAADYRRTDDGLMCGSRVGRPPVGGDADAGPGGLDAGLDAGTRLDASSAQDDASTGDAGSRPPESGGCGCSAARPRDGRGVALAALLPLLVLVRWRARGRRRG